MKNLIGKIIKKIILPADFVKRDKEGMCLSCGAYSGHSPNCPDIDLEEAKKQLKEYHKLWLTKEMWTRKRCDFWKKDAERWKGKFFELKHENNTLRKKITK
jgi:predicted metal-binding protein